MLSDSKIVFNCSVKGKLRIKTLRTTNPIAVGDNVLFEIEKKTNKGIISEVLDRKNYILRKSSNLSKQSQILAANIDQVFLMITIILPETPLEFIDRFLITAEAYRIPARIIINKTDVYGEFENATINNLGEVIPPTERYRQFLFSLGSFSYSFLLILLYLAM